MKDREGIPRGEYCYGVEMWGFTLCPFSNKSQVNREGDCSKYGCKTKWNEDNGSGSNYLKCPACLKSTKGGNPQ